MYIATYNTVKTDVLWWHKECAVVAQLCYILSKIGQNIAQMCYHSTSFLQGSYNIFIAVISQLRSYVVIYYIYIYIYVYIYIYIYISFKDFYQL